MENREIEIIKSTEYNAFKYIIHNRDLKESHVLKLMDSIKNKNLLKIQPCIISESNEIIDGQHRIEAAKRLEIPFYYIKSCDINESDIITLNNIKMSWSVIDFINFYASKNHETYKIVLDLINRYPDISLKSVLACVSPTGKNPISDIKSGKIRCLPIEKINKFMDILSDYKNLTSFWSERDFILAIKKLSANIIQHRDYKGFKYDHDKFIKKIIHRKISLDEEFNRSHFNGEYYLTGVICRLHSA